MNLKMFLKCAPGRGLILGALLVFLLQIQAGAGVWEALQNRYAPESLSGSTEKQTPGQDPWARLRAIYLPFSEEIETAALTDHKAAKKVSGHLHKALRPYTRIIDDASRRFGIPPEIIGAVIMAESGGNARAKATTSTAKGLMQTIEGTFRDAREDLLSQGILIEDDPFDPQASIIAGAWYLDRMYKQSSMDRKRPDLNRQDIASWRYPVEYYYAGPGHGRKKKKRVIIYAGGKKVVIDKPAYSRKVLQWAEIMGRSGWEDHKSKGGQNEQRKKVLSYKANLFTPRTVETVNPFIGAYLAVWGLCKLPAAHQTLYQRAGRNRCLSPEEGHAHLRQRSERPEFCNYRY